jgi:large subunit ribosomal protein L9
MATAINVILTEDSIAGKAGELVKVRMGYARNYLLPKGIAVVADLYNMKMYEDQKAELEKQANERREASEAAKEQIGEDAVVTIQSKAGESGKLFGAVTKEKIASAITEQLKVPVTKESVTIPTPIKSIGQHKSQINLGSNITAEVIVKVEQENN